MAADLPFVAVVVLTLDGWADTEACLRSLRAVIYGGRLVVVVADNGSTDGTVAALRAGHPEVEVVENGANLGFAAGNNAGVARALQLGAEAVLVLNNDTEVEPGFLEPLVAALAEDTALGLVSPAILQLRAPTTGRVWFCGAEVRPGTGHVVHRQFPPGEGWRAPGVTTTPSVTGCAVLVPRAVWERLGGFDERLFLLFEDSDLSRRATALGYRLGVVADSVVHHRGGATFARVGAGDFYFLRNGLRFVTGSGRQPARRALAFLVEYLARPLARGVRDGEADAWRLAFVRAVGAGAFLVGQSGPAPRWVGPLVRGRPQSRATPPASVQEAPSVGGVEAAVVGPRVLAPAAAPPLAASTADGGP